MDEESKSQTEDILGSVMVIGGGIAGMQASLDLADTANGRSFLYQIDLIA